MTQLNQSTWDNYVQLVTIDLTPWGDQKYGFIDASTYQAGTPQLGGLIWQGQYYTPLPYISSGWQRGSQNPAKPKLSLPDFGAAMYVTLKKYNLAAGAQIVRYQAFGSDILANNANAAFLAEIYLLSSVGFNGQQIDIDLATHLDFQRAQFPRHVMMKQEYPGLAANTAR